MPEFHLLPAAAAVSANGYDWLWWYEVAISVIMTALIFAAVFFFAIKYRRRSETEIPRPIEGSRLLEIGWSVIPFLVMLTFFFWGAALYFPNQDAPKDAMNIYVVAKQWMWKVQYPNGVREINELHVPVGRAVKLTMASEDVIHSFFVPAFRLKRDVVPGRYNDMWFTATKPGRYHLFCAEYCGTEHSGMIGWVTVMEKKDFENWLTSGGGEGSMASQGQKIFQQLGCSTCHLFDEQGRCPNLKGMYGSRVLLSDGRTVIADEAYIRESILDPNAKIVAGFQKDVMPTFQGLLSEEEILEVTEYIKSLSNTRSGMFTSEQTGPTAGGGRGGSIANAGQGSLDTRGTSMTNQPPRPEANAQAQDANQGQPVAPKPVAPKAATPGGKQ
jgi:cytochrome c oxidase subunit 2